MTALDHLTFLSVDVETSSKVAGTGHLLSVGIVPIVKLPAGWVPMQGHDTLYIRLEHSVNLDHRHNPNVDSIGWWVEQDPVVQREAFDQSLLRFPRRTAAKMITEFVRGINDDAASVIFVANPVAFDKPWVDQMIVEAGLELPWTHRSLCLRSMKFGTDIGAGFGSDRTTRRSEVPHHALWDAEAQARDLCDMLSARRGLGFTHSVKEQS